MNRVLTISCLRSPKSWSSRQITEAWYMQCTWLKLFDFSLVKHSPVQFFLCFLRTKLGAKLTVLCNYLWVIHEPNQASLLRVQYKIASQELATALILLNVQKATDAVLSVHIRHLATGTFPGLLRPGEETEEPGQAGLGRIPSGQRDKQEEREMCGGFQLSFCG